MKLSSSSALDLSSTYATPCCLSGVLRRIFCASLCRGPRIHGEEASTAPKLDAVADKEKSPAPGIVALLMGLDPMPDSIVRSRSTNSIESWPGFLSDRTKISSPEIGRPRSFGDAPACLFDENEDFLILSFTSDDEQWVFSSDVMKPEMCISEFEGRAKGSGDRVRGSRAERRMVEKKAKKMIRQRDLRKKDAKKWEMPGKLALDPSKESNYADREVESECSSQNSSPVSVLDPLIDEEDQDGNQKHRNSRRKLSSDPLSLVIASLPISRHELMRQHDEKSGKSIKLEEACIDFRQTGLFNNWLEEENLKVWNWVSRKKEESEDVGEIIAEFCKGIMDSLLLDAVAEFSDCTTPLENCI